MCLLVAQGAEISCKDKRGYTPLHAAASSGQITVVKHLLNLAVEVNKSTHTFTRSCSKSRITPVYKRFRIRNTSPLFVLPHRQIDESNAFGNTALHLACFHGQDATVSELIDCGANVSQPNNKGFTPLHFAAASSHGALCLELLVNNGADVNVQVSVCPDAYSFWLTGFGVILCPFFNVKMEFSSDKLLLLQLQTSLKHCF